MTLDVTNLICTACTLVCGWVYNRSRDNERRSEENQKAIDLQNIEIAKLHSILHERRGEHESLKAQMAAMAGDIKILLPVPSMLVNVKEQLDCFVPREELNVRFDNLEKRHKI